MAALLKGNTVLEPLIRIALVGPAWARAGLIGKASGMIPATAIRALIRGAITAARQTAADESADGLGRKR